MKFKVAFAGIFKALKNEVHMRIHVLVAILVCIAGVYFEISRWDWIAVIICIGAVISAELFNSALEELCDTVHPGQHKGIGLTKDMAAGAVLVTAIGAAVVGVIVFLPHLNALVH